ncbi:hypothetical protein STEG23_018451 [Scotinomys teguina]
MKTRFCYMVKKIGVDHDIRFSSSCKSVDDVTSDFHNHKIVMDIQISTLSQDVSLECFADPKQRKVKASQRDKVVMWNIIHLQVSPAVAFNHSIGHFIFLDTSFPYKSIVYLECTLNITILTKKWTEMCKSLSTDNLLSYIQGIEEVMLKPVYSSPLLHPGH